jgi:hypothetical protein
MRERSGLSFQLVLFCAVLLASVVGVITQAKGTDVCPVAADEIATDRPDVTNSSLVVPRGSLQFENGVDWTTAHGSDALDGTNTRVRLGVAHCTEFLIDIPNYFASLNGSGPSGFSDVVLSFKRQLPISFGFDLSTTTGLGFASGAGRISGQGYQPYIQFPWSHEIVDPWEIEGMFTLTWFPSDPERNPTFESTFSLERAFGPAADMFVEYVGDYDHERPSQVLDTGGAWRFTRTQQLDFHVGFGLNRSSVDHYLGIGYSFRLDGLFGGSVGRSR